MPPLLNNPAIADDPVWRSQLFEQYKLYLDGIQKNSDRRTSANNYLLTVNTAIIAIYGFSDKITHSFVWAIIIPVSGILASFLWFRIIESYRNLNTVKFEVLHKLEANLPANLFSHEWEIAEEGQTSKYRPFSHIEKNIPLIFILLYVVIIAAAMADKFKWF